MLTYMYKGFEQQTERRWDRSQCQCVWVNAWVWMTLAARP